MKDGVGISFPFGGISHDLATNKFVEARTVLSHGVSSLVSGMAEVPVAETLGCRGVGCCSIGGLLRLGINGTSPPWAFCIEELGTCWIFALGTLYTINGFSISLTLNCFLMGILLLLFSFLSMDFLGTGAFCSEVGFTTWLELECGWLASWPFNTKQVGFLLTKDE